MSMRPKNELDSAVDVGLRPFTYRYRNPADAPTSTPNAGRMVGILAQNLQKHPLTAQTVTPTHEGLKVEIGPMVSLLAGVAGRHHERLEQHEHALRKLHEIITRRLGRG
jgi:hypothetical protein